MSINVSISKFEQDRSIEKKNRREVGDLSIHDWDEAGHVVKNKHTKFEQDRSIEKNIYIFFFRGRGVSVYPRLGRSRECCEE